MQALSGIKWQLVVSYLGFLVIHHPPIEWNSFVGTIGCDKEPGRGHAVGTEFLLPVWLLIELEQHSTSISIIFRQQNQVFFLSVFLNI